MVPKSEEKTIGELKFVTTKLPAMRGFALLAKLVKAVGPALGALMKLDPNTQLDAGNAEIAFAFAAIDPTVAEALVPEILAATTVIIPDATGGRELPLMKRENIDLAFSEAGLTVMFQVIGFVLQVNYRDFSRGSAPAAPQHLVRKGA